MGAFTQSLEMKGTILQEEDSLRWRRKLRNRLYYRRTRKKGFLSCESGPFPLCSGTFSPVSWYPPDCIQVPKSVQTIDKKIFFL